MPVSCSFAATSFLIVLCKRAACASMLFKDSVASLPVRQQRSLLESEMLPVSDSSIQAALCTFPCVCAALFAPPAEHIFTLQIAYSLRCLGSDYLQHISGDEQEPLPQHGMYAALAEKSYGGPSLAVVMYKWKAHNRGQACCGQQAHWDFSPQTWQMPF